MNTGLLGLSNRDIFRDACQEPFLPTEEYLRQRNTHIDLSPQWLWERIWRGSAPELYTGQEVDVQNFYANYLNACLARDLQPSGHIKDIQLFQDFIVALAARTGQLLNMAGLGKEIGVDQRTIKKWLRILIKHNIIYLLQPCELPTTKKLVKTPKVYFLDTGLVCYLGGWLSGDNAQRGALSTRLYETFIFSEIYKSYNKAGKEPKFSFYRDGNNNEIFLLIENENIIYPLSIKKTGIPNLKDIRIMASLQEACLKTNFDAGAVICNINAPMIIAADIRAIPLKYI